MGDSGQRGISQLLAKKFVSVEKVKVKFRVTKVKAHTVAFGFHFYFYSSSFLNVRCIFQGFLVMLVTMSTHSPSV